MKMEPRFRSRTLSAVTETSDMTHSAEAPKATCERILAGESLRDICCDDPDMASLAPISLWLAGEAGTAYRQSTMDLIWPRCYPRPGARRKGHPDHLRRMSLAGS